MFEEAVIQGLTPLATDRRPFGTCIWHPKECSLALKYRSASLPTDPGTPGTRRSAATKVEWSPYTYFGVSGFRNLALGL